MIKLNNIYIAKLNMFYKRAYNIHKNNIDILENYTNDYLINIANYIASKINTNYIKYNEIDKVITLKNNKDNVIKIKVYNQYLQIIKDNNIYIIRDANSFIYFVEDFIKDLENINNES